MCLYSAFTFLLAFRYLISGSLYILYKLYPIPPLPNPTSNNHRSDLFSIVCFMGNIIDLQHYGCVRAKLHQSCPALCDPMDCRICQAPPPMGILQARILEWVAMPSSRISSGPRDQT